MQSNFQTALAFTLKYEGGFVNDPRDPGGATNLGITFATFKRYYGAMANVTQLHALTAQQASAIYKAGYWDEIKGDTLPSGVDLLAFDIAVNMGTGRANGWLRATDTLPSRERILDLHNKRIGFWRSLKTFSHFGRGWTARETACLAAALSLLPKVASQPKGIVPMLTTTKSAVASQTIWGSLIALLGGAGGAYTAWKTGDVNSLALAISAVFGGIIAIIGRFKATTTIGKTAVSVATEALILAENNASMISSAIARAPQTATVVMGQVVPVPAPVVVQVPVAQTSLPL